MANPAGESNDGVLRLDFDHRLTLEFRGAVVISDERSLAYRELDNAHGLTTTGSPTRALARTAGTGLLRKSVFGCFAGYEDANDAERLRHEPPIRWIVGFPCRQSNPNIRRELVWGEYARRPEARGSGASLCKDKWVRALL